MHSGPIVLTTLQVHDQQAPWPQDLPAQDSLPPPTFVTIVQLAHVVGLLGLVNVFLLYTARRYLFQQPAIQERVVSALLTPLMFGDILHLAFTFYALGDDRWRFGNWKNAGTLWVTVITGFSLLIPRLAWHLGIGRYMDSRDRKKE